MTRRPAILAASLTALAFAVYAACNPEVKPTECDSYVAESCGGEVTPPSASGVKAEADCGRFSFELQGVGKGSEKISRTRHWFGGTDCWPDEDLGTEPRDLPPSVGWEATDSQGNSFSGTGSEAVFDRGSNVCSATCTFTLTVSPTKCSPPEPVKKTGTAVFENAVTVTGGGPRVCTTSESHSAHRFPYAVACAANKKSKVTGNAEKVSDDHWPMGGIFWELTNKRAEEKVVSYVESHDQALVGGKTFFFTLADAAIYYGMGKDQHGLEVDRAVALHKMARLATCALNGGAYLNFMGNEFGHPEWIDFPRQDNGWSYSHARRQWSLRDNPDLRFKALGDFDEAMLAALAKNLKPRGRRKMLRPIRLLANEPDKVLAFIRGELLFVFNFHPTQSYTDYGVIVPPATKWEHLFDSDEVRFGGQGRIAPGQRYEPQLVKAGEELVQQLKLYLPARTAIVLRHVK